MRNCSITIARRRAAAIDLNQTSPRERSWPASKESSKMARSTGAPAAGKPGKNREEEHIVEKAKQDLQAYDESGQPRLGQYVAIAGGGHRSTPWVGTVGRTALRSLAPIQFLATLDRLFIDIGEGRFEDIPDRLPGATVELKQSEVLDR